MVQFMNFIREKTEETTEKRKKGGRAMGERTRKNLTV
jgi:hypothetical protein